MKCGYCDFTSYADVPDDAVDALLAAWLAELQTRAQGLRPHTIFLGGGTPTFLSLPRLQRVLEAVEATCDLSGLIEFSCEANPESCAREKLQLLANKGVTRISLGVQAFDAARLAFLDRPHDVAQAERAVAEVQDLRLPCSVDLIYGTPGHSVAAWETELEHALALGTAHLSCYHLTFEPGTRLWAARTRGEVGELDEHIGRDLLVQTHQRLAEAALPAYEVSNFAAPGAECQHNLNYWRAGDYIGIGPGAASHANGRRTTNVRGLETYVQAIRDRGSATGFAETLEPHRRAGEAAWLGLRLRQGADLAAIELRTGCDVRQTHATALERTLQAGHTELVEERWLRIPEEQLPYTDGIAAQFLTADERDALGST